MPCLEWLETDGVGGFASGTCAGIPTRKYHSLLTTRVGNCRYQLLNSVEAILEVDGHEIPLTTAPYSGGVFAPSRDGIFPHLEDFGYLRCVAGKHYLLAGDATGWKCNHT